MSAATTMMKTDTTAPPTAKTSSSAKWGDRFNYLALAIQLSYLCVLMTATSTNPSEPPNWAAKLIGPEVSSQGFCVRDQGTLYSSHMMGFIFAVVAVPCLIMLYNLLDNLRYKGITNWFLADTYGSVLIHGVMHGALAVLSHNGVNLSGPSTLKQLLNHYTQSCTTVRRKETCVAVEPNIGPWHFAQMVVVLTFAMYWFFYLLLRASPGAKDSAGRISFVASVIHAIFCPPRVSFTYVLTVLQFGPVVGALHGLAGPKDEYYRLFAQYSYLVIAIAAWIEPFNCQTTNEEGEPVDWWYMHLGGHVIFDIMVAGSTVVFVWFALPVAEADAGKKTK